MSTGMSNFAWPAMPELKPSVETVETLTQRLKAAEAEYRKHLAAMQTALSALCRADEQRPDSAVEQIAKLRAFISEQASELMQALQRAGQAEQERDSLRRAFTAQTGLLRVVQEGRQTLETAVKDTLDVLDQEKADAALGALVRQMPVGYKLSNVAIVGDSQSSWRFESTDPCFYRFGNTPEEAILAIFKP
jgi:hypothetical protein